MNCRRSLPSPASNGLLLPVDLMKDVPGVHFESALTRLKAGGDASPRPATAA